MSAHPELVRATSGLGRAAPLDGPWPFANHRTLAEVWADRDPTGDPYGAGWDALRRGFDLVACPHRCSTAARALWIRGWTDCALDLAKGQP